MLTRKFLATMTLCHLPALAASSSVTDWPDGVDATITAFFLALALGVPMAGYVLMALDFRAYLRSLRRAIAVVADWVPATPYWALRERPPCLITLDLFPPITEAEVMEAYRERVKQLHPDRGGDLRKFLQLQRHFEQALHLARQRAKRSVPGEPAP